MLILIIRVLNCRDICILISPSMLVIPSLFNPKKKKTVGVGLCTLMFALICQIDWICVLNVISIPKESTQCVIGPDEIALLRDDIEQMERLFCRRNWDSCITNNPIPIGQSNRLDVTRMISQRAGSLAGNGPYEHIMSLFMHFVKHFGKHS